MADDRYSTITREVPVDRPRNTVFAATAGASGELNSQHRVTEHPAGFRVRERGAIDATVVHAYRCPVHGVFEVAVPRSTVPDAVLCAVRDEHEQMWGACGRASPWAGSSCGIGHAAGEVTS